MIDNFALGLSHGLMMLAAWYLLRSPALDREPHPRDAVLENSRKSEFYAPSAQFPASSKDIPPVA